jgi:hypothetical protein
VERLVVEARKLSLEMEEVLEGVKDLTLSVPEGSIFADADPRRPVERAILGQHTNGSLYRVAAPLVNVLRAPGEWHSFDFILHAPSCSNWTLASPGDITLSHNGVLVLDRVVPRVRHDQCQSGTTEMRSPLMLQDHEPSGGPMIVMRCRNIRFSPLPAEVSW